MKSSKRFAKALTKAVINSISAPQYTPSNKQNEDINEIMKKVRATNEKYNSRKADLSSSESSNNNGFNIEF